MVTALLNSASSVPNVLDSASQSLSSTANEYHFELTIVLPAPPYADAARNSSFPALVLPASSKELVRDLKAVVIESPEGFWLGSFALAREGDDSEAPLGDWDEIGSAFVGKEYADLSKRRAVRIIDVILEEPEARSHVLRLRDILQNTSPALAGRKGFDRTYTVSTSTVVEAGCSQYPILRNDANQKNSSVDTAEGDFQYENVTRTALYAHDGETDHVSELNPPASPRKRRGHGKSRSRAKQHDFNGHAINNVETKAQEDVSRPQLTSDSNETSATPPKVGTPQYPVQTVVTSHPFDQWSQDDAFADPLACISRCRMGEQPSVPPVLVMEFAVSPYSPPPPHLRLRGHYLYLFVKTLEDKILHISATSRGYFVNRSNIEKAFDPSPRHDNDVHASLFSLLASESPGFVRNLQLRLQPLCPDIPDTYANTVPAACALSTPWLVRRPGLLSDQLRTQLAFVTTGQIQPELSPPAAREWNEEFVTVREMPRKTPSERLNRDRMLARLQNDFAAAAARAVQMIVRAEITPINPNEPKSTYTYLHNNILFVAAEDPQGQHVMIGGDEAVRVSTLKDLHGVRLLNALDLEGVHPIGTVIVDYLGERWICQTLLPGLLGPSRPEESAVFSGPVQDGEQSKTRRNDTTKFEANDDGNSHRDTLIQAVVEQPADCNADPSKVNETMFKIVYGSTDTERPENGSIAVDVKCQDIASKVAQHLHLSPHTVKDPTTDTLIDMWLPIETKGILGTDGRTYLIDLYRLQPVDIVWLEKDLEGPLLTLEHPPLALHRESNKNVLNGVNDSDRHIDSECDLAFEALSTPKPTTYPHHFVLLRPQLLEKFREDELRRFIQERVTMGRLGVPSQPEGEAMMEWQHIAREAHALPTLRPSSDGDDSSKEMIDSVAATGHSIFEMSSFEVSFNPNAFVERPGGPQHGSFPESDKTSKLVRAASTYLREFLLPDFVSDVVVITPQPHDGTELTKQMHERGIPMRYLGYMAVACEKPPRGLPERHAPSAITPMAHLKSLALNEMVFRAAKHILRRVLRSRPACEVAPSVSHFLNCLVGDLMNPYPRPDLTELPSPLRSSCGEWSRLSVASLRNLLCDEIACRFRFAMPTSFFHSAAFARPQLLRDVASRCGIQLALHSYIFASDPLNLSAPNITTVIPDDIINIAPIVHSTPHKASWIDEHFESGQQHVRLGQVQIGEGIINEALSFSEQVFGTVHPDLARRFHDLAVLYHSVATPLMRNANIFEHGHALSSSVDERIRSQKDSGIESKEQMFETKREAQAFFEHAVRMARQSVLIAERCLGLDHYETLQHYIDLAILEHANDCPRLALSYCKHALEMLVLICGDFGRAHTDWSRIMLNISQIVQAWQGYKAAAPLFRLTHDITAIARGTETYVTATVFGTCAAGLANGGHLKEAIQFQKEALAIFVARFGETDERTREAETTLDQLTKLAVRKERGENERVIRLMRRMRTDEVRAREIIARSSKSDKVTQGHTMVQSAVSNGPQYAHLDIDDIVKIIEGKSASSKTPRARARD